MIYIAWFLAMIAGTGVIDILITSPFIAIPVGFFWGVGCAICAIAMDR